jgi:hypothetical protein
MEYAITELKKMAKISRLDKSVLSQIGAEEYLNTALFLESNCLTPSEIPYSFLRDLYKSIYEGLQGWGENYQEQKKRQKKRLDDVRDALIKIENKRGRTFRGASYNDYLK